jgi:hypothetical protein
MVWEVENWQYRQSAVVGEYLRCAVQGEVMAVYDGRRIWLADVRPGKAVVFQELLPSFWV